MIIRNAKVASGSRGLCFMVVLIAFLGIVCPRVMGGDGIEPGAIEIHPTWGCLGVNWHFKGDDNRGASVSVKFRRKGAAVWRKALPLWRHEYKQTVMFSGSVFRLAPGVDYELLLTLTDTDGGGAVRTVEASTLKYPKMPARTIRVAEGGLYEAQKLAKPGTVMLLPKGTYSGALLTKSGRPGEWIVYRSAGDGEVIIEGQTRIDANYVWLHGLTLRSKGTTIRGSHKGVCITGCRLIGHYAVHTPRGAENYFISDNVFIGDAKGRFGFDGEGVDFGKDVGGGHALCFNDITDFADGMSYGSGNIDVYNNYIHETMDDFIEPDYSHENYRVWNNRCYNSMCGFSFQPMKGGPWYMFNNINVGTYLHPFKVKDITGPSVIYGNSILVKNQRLLQGADFLRGTIINNVWLRAMKGPLARGGKFNPAFSPTMVDYNAYGTGGDEPWSRIEYTKLASGRNWDKHSIHVDYRDVLRETVKVPTGNPHYGRDVHKKLIPTDWHFEHILMLPKAGTKLIDAGGVLDNLTGPFLGKAPDMGAHELGLGTAWYGPRKWDLETGLVYALPKGWKKIPPVQSTDYAKIGCPRVKNAKVLLGCESPRVFALMWTEPAVGEACWKQAALSVKDDAGAVTGVLNFQDGLFMRLYHKGDNALLTVARVEDDAVLHVAIGCAWKDIGAARLTMFQFARSLYR